jgi:D-lyxose ketol-isomerase
MLGWDITDFGLGRYPEIGLLLFTLRNGPHGQSRAEGRAKDYCEKLLLIDQRQVTPCHFHWSKMEDIINRGGGRLEVVLWHADRQTEQLDRESAVHVSIDGVRRCLSPGGSVVLEPGQSITLPPFLYHSFWAQDGRGMVLGGEVSRVNDDSHDNRFLEPLPRFPVVEEDEPPLHLLCTEYPSADG